MSTLSNPISFSSSTPATTAEMAPQILGESVAMQRLRMQVRRLGPHFRTVLLRGEAGTGKELVARALHSFSSHAEGPFVVFDAGNTSESSAPGAGRGAGIRGREKIRRLMQAAHRGTLYLARIEELDVEAQAELPAVLKGRDRARRGPIVVHGLEARVIASTTGNLRALAATNRFTEELRARLTTVELELCPLRERPEDLAVLSEYFIARYAARYNKQMVEITQETVARMQEYRWPGNVQELKDRLRHAVTLGVGDILLPEERETLMGAPDQADTGSSATTARLQQVVEQHVFQVLKECAGNKVRAAELLGISRSTLYRMLDAGLQGDRMVGLRQPTERSA